MDGYIKTAELQSILHLSRPAVLEKARREQWPAVKQGKTFLWQVSALPSDIRLALQKKSPTETKADERILAGEDFLSASEKQKEIATFRAALIFEYQRSGMGVQEFCEAYNDCNAFPVLFQKLGKVPASTFYRWLKHFNEGGASGIVAKYGIHRGGAGESLSEEEKALLKRFWLRDCQPTMMHAYRLMKENIPYSRASYQTAARYLKSIPKPVAGLFRLGESRFENLFLPHMEQRLDEYASLEVVVSDHHCVDCVVSYQGKLVRPWVTTFQDLRSGKVVGWCPSVKPSSLSIVAAYYMCCIRYGVPKGVLFDNGKDYRSKWLNGDTQSVKVLTPEGVTEEQEVFFKGVFRLIGSQVHFTRTYNGKSKGRQERFFRIIGEYLAKDIGSYVGSDSRSRPEDAALFYRALNGKAKRNDVPDWVFFVNALGSVIEHINDTFQSFGVGMNGKTRSQVFEENLVSENVRHPSKEELQTALMKGQVRRCGRNGVKIGGVNYWHPDLFEFVGRDVLVYENLLTTEDVTVCRPDGSFLCCAVANYFTETGIATADQKRLENERKRLTELATLGSGEVSAAPEVDTMIEVAMRQYQGGELPAVDRFLGIESSSEPKHEKKVVGQKTNLKNPFYE